MLGELFIQSFKMRDVSKRQAHLVMNGGGMIQ
jgi:hypothetical protein